MTYAKRSWRATGLSVILLMLGGCASASRADFCILYQPVYTARGDTEATRKQVDGNNAAWLALCGRGSR